MKILKKRNGLALVSVMVLLLFLTLLVPVMLNYASSATRIAVKGSDMQKSSYLSRAGLEMAVAAIKKTIYDTSGEYFDYYQEELSEDGDEISLETVYMYTDVEKTENVRSGKQEYQVHYATENDKDSYDSNTEKYTFVGSVNSSVKYNNSCHVYKIKSEDGTYVDLCCGTAAERAELSRALGKNEDGNPYVGGAVDDYPVVSCKDKGYNYVKYKYDQYDFTSVSTVNGVSTTRTASAMKTVDTAKNGWLATSSDGIVKAEPSGLLQVSVNPDKATSKQLTYYEDANVGTVTVDGKLMIAEDILLYSTMGNLVVSTDFSFKNLTNDQIRVGNNASLSDGAITAMKELPVYLGTNPNLQYHKRSTDGSVNNWMNAVTFHKGEAVYEPVPIGTTGAVHKKNGEDGVEEAGWYLQVDVSGARSDNFVYFAATGAIAVDMPIDVTVNPARYGGASRLGDGTILSTQMTTQGSIYKMIGFQSSDITFNGTITMCMSFVVPTGFVNDATTGKRMGSVVLSAPSSTPYSYKKTDGTIVKAGKVYFQDDVYVIIYDYEDHGETFSDDTISFFAAQTKYYNYQKNINEGYGINKELKATYDNNGVIVTMPSNTVTHKTGVSNYKHYTIYKLFNAGDVCYFNAEKTKKIKGEEANVGISLMNWFVDAVYLDEIAPGKEEDIFRAIKNWFVSAFQNFFYGAFTQGTYDKDDIVYIGNAKEDFALAPDDVNEDLFVVWND